MNVLGVFLIIPLTIIVPLFALVHPFIPTIPPCLNNFHDLAVCFASPSCLHPSCLGDEYRVCSCGETSLDVKTLAHSTSKSLPLFYFSLG